MALRHRRFLEFRRTERAARNAGKSIGDYLEGIWNCEGQADRISCWMQRIGCYSHCETIVEIGPGSGRFLRPTLERARPLRYEIYETAPRWADWLTAANQPHVVNQPADGCSLGATSTSVCGLVHAHGVFVYLNPLTCFDYFQEMIRVTTPGGHVVFDFFSSEGFDEKAVLAWLATSDRFATMLPRKLVTSFFERRGFDLIGTSARPVGAGRATYVAFRHARACRSSRPRRSRREQRG
jgi:SAM-dependent methyltransferase